MSHIVKFELKSKDEIKEVFNFYISNLRMNKSILYHCPFLSTRQIITEWLKAICYNLSLSNDTLFSSIYILDTYIEIMLNHSFEINDIYFTAIACLSLATKQNETNCNYTQYFTQFILNQIQFQHYMTKDLGKREMEILKVLNFKLNYTNPYHFTLLFLQICFNYCKDVNCLNNIIIINENIIKQILIMDVYISIHPLAIAYYAIEESLKQIGNEYIDKQKIQIDIKELLSEKHIIPMMNKKLISKEVSPFKMANHVHIC